MAHALDGGDVDEGVAELGIGEQRVRHDVGVELLVLVEVVLLEALGVDRVDLVELQARLGLEARRRPGRPARPARGGRRGTARGGRRRTSSAGRSR